MSVTYEKPSPTARKVKLGDTSDAAYESVASGMVSITALLGSLVFCLFLIWLGMKVFQSPPPLPALEYEELGGGTPDGVLGESLKMDGPLEEQVAPQTDQQEQSIEQMLERVETDVAERQAELDDPVITEEVITAGKKVGSDGTGKHRNKGLGPGDGGGVPAALRWVIAFDEGGSLEEYARQLDYFQIELGVIGASNQIHYAKGLAGTPQSRSGKGEDEKRLFFSWQSGARQQADRALLSKAGIQATGKTVVHFYDLPTKEILFTTEKAYLKSKFPNRDMREIWRTRFMIRKAGSGYEFVVVEQSYF